MARSSFSFEHLRDGSIDNATTREVADIFLQTFYHEPFGQYLLKPSTGQAFSAEQIMGFDSKHGGYRPLAELAERDPGEFAEQVGEQPYFWMDPERTRELFRKKFRKDAYLTLMRSEETGEIQGITAGYERPMGEAFAGEEWHDPYYYSTFKDSGRYRSLDRLLNSFNSQLSPEKQLQAETRVFILGFVLIKPEARHPYTYFELMRRFLEQASPEALRGYILGEVPGGSMGHLAMLAHGGIVASDYLGQEHHIAASPLAEGLAWFSQEKPKLMRDLKETNRARLARLDPVAHAA